jgi:hypothetical protein
MTITDTQWLIIAVIVVAMALGLGAWFVLQQRKQSLRLKGQFGAEYGHAVDSLGGRSKAESELKAREKRVRGFSITPLSIAEAARFTRAWNALQGRFIDSPKGVLIEADQLVRDLLLKRGYPAADFERTVADVSVDHSAIVQTYRKARAISDRDQRGEADTEELRQAVVHYRTLFNELLTVEEPSDSVAPPSQLLAQP